MLKQLFALCALSAVSLMGCQCGSTAADRPVNETPTTTASASPTLKRVFVVIDGSSSLNDAACKQIDKLVGDVFDALGELQDLRVFTTIEGTRSQPVFQWKKVPPTRPSEEKEFYKDTIPAKKKRLDDAVMAACKKGNNGSYILHAIQSAYANLEGAEQADESLLLILSDMLECSPGYYGCSEGEAPGFKKMSEQIGSSPLAASCLLSKAIPLDNIRVCVISMNNEQKFVQLSSSPECKAFWDAAFRNMGFETGPQHATDIGDFLDKIRS